MTLTLSPARLALLFAEPPELFELHYRSGRGDRWRRVTSGTHAECVAAISKVGDWALRPIREAEGDLGLFADENAT